MPHCILCNWQVHDTVTSGGKVLVPVFAVGRAQELLMLLDEHWQRTQLEVSEHTKQHHPLPPDNSLKDLSRTLGRVEARTRYYTVVCMCVSLCAAAAPTTSLLL